MRLFSAFRLGFPRTPCLKLPAVLGMLFVAGSLALPAVGDPVTELISLANDGTRSNGESLLPSISGDGRYVVFISSATNLTSIVDPGAEALFLRDRLLGTTVCLSIRNGFVVEGTEPAISADGRYVAFRSGASLIAGLVVDYPQVYVYDLQTSTYECVSVASDGTVGEGRSELPSISADGRCVAFMSTASNLVPGDTNGFEDVFVRDRLAGTTERVSVATDGTQANFYPVSAAISGDGQQVAFASAADNLVTGDTNHYGDVFIHDRQSGITSIVSVGSDGSPALGDSYHPVLNSDGSLVAFQSDAANLVAGKVPTVVPQVYVRDRTHGTTEMISVAPDGSPADGSCNDVPSMTPDGRFVAFESYAGNLAANRNRGIDEVFVRDRLLETTERISVGPDGKEANFFSGLPSINGDGTAVAFQSEATNLLISNPIDTFEPDEIYVRGPKLVRNTQLAAPSLTGRIGQTVNLTATLTLTATGAPLAGMTIRFEMDSAPIGSAVTMSNGSASIAYTIPEGAGPGSRTVNAYYDAASAYDTSSATSTLKVTRGIPGFSMYAVSGTAGQTVDLRTLFVCGGAAILARIVQFTVDGTPGGIADSDASGATLPFKIPAAMASGSHNVTVSFAGDAMYNAGSRTSPALWVKPKVAFSLYAASGVAGHSVVLHTLVYGAGKAVAGLAVQFAVDGTPIGTAISDATGASISYAIPAAMATGPHDVTVSFAGNTLYTAATRTTAALTVKAAVLFSLSKASGAAGATVQLKTLVYSGGAPVSGLLIKFAVDGVPAGTATSDSSGASVSYTIPALLAPGLHDVTVTFAGNATYATSTRTTPALTVK